VSDPSPETLAIQSPTPVEAPPPVVDQATPPEAKEPASLLAPKEDAAPEPVVEAEAVDYATLTLPEGLTADDPLLADATKIFGEHKLPKEAAQQLVDWFVKNRGEATQAIQTAAVEQTHIWEAELRADPELGGPKWAATEANVAKAAEIMPPDLVNLLNSQSLGTYPPLIKFLAKVGDMVSEDRLLTGRPPAAKVDELKEMFPSSYAANR
jgi:hypothetical protein